MQIIFKKKLDILGNLFIHLLAESYMRISMGIVLLPTLLTVSAKTERYS